MSQGPTLEVIENHGVDVALHFHLTSRCFPPAPHMVSAASAAIDALLEDEPDRMIELPAGMTYKGSTEAPAAVIARTWRLEAFLPDDEDECVDPLDYALSQVD